MNINYLYSIIELYLKKETDDKRTNLNIIRENNQIHFKFNMNKNDSDMTSFSLLSDVVLENNVLSSLIKLYKKQNIIIDEKYEVDKVNGSCYYYALFNNGRSISFRNFSLVEINNIRNIIYDIKFKKE